MVNCAQAGTCASPACAVTDSVATNTREYISCSGRGLCDRDEGTCHCFTGFKGAACDIEQSGIVEYNDNQVRLALNGPMEQTSDGLYEGSILKLQVIYPPICLFSNARPRSSSDR